MRICFFILLFALSRSCFAQDTFIDMKFKIVKGDSAGIPFPGVLITVIKNDTLHLKTASDTSGFAAFRNLPANAYYQIKFSHPGYYTKMIEIGSNDMADPGVIPLRAECSMERPFSHENMAALDTVPMVKFYWDMGQLTFDHNYIKRQMKILDMCSKGYTFVQASVYASEINNGQLMEKNNQFVAACNAYQLAYEQIQSDLLKANIDRLIPLAKLETIAADCRTYDDYIFVADGFFDEKKYDLALNYYETASNIEATDYVLMQLKKCKNQVYTPGGK